MTYRKFAKLLVLVAVTLTVCAGGAWAENLEDTFNWGAIRVDLKHITRASIVNGKTEYFPSADPSAELKALGAGKPYFYYIHLDVSNVSDDLYGKIRFTPKDALSVDFYNIATQEKTFGDVWPANNPASFKFWPWPGDPYSHYVGFDLEGSEADFNGKAENALSGREFYLEVNSPTAVPDVTGSFSAFRTTAAQVSGKCVPYMELTGNDTTVTGFNWKFVDPSAGSSLAALQQSAAHDVIRIDRVWVRTWDNTSDQFEVTQPRIAAGATLQGTEPLPRAYAKENIRFIELTFSFSDRLTANCQTQYKWRFYPAWAAPVAPTPTPNNESYLYMLHYTRSPLVDGKANYSVQTPNFRYIIMEVDYSGEVNKNTDGTLALNGVSYTPAVRDSRTAEPTLFQTILNTDAYLSLYPIFEDDSYYHYAGEKNKWDTPYMLLFAGPAETGLSQKNFSYVIGNYAKSGVTPKIRPASEQLQTIVPYLEYIKSGNMVTGVNWRFVEKDKPDVALKKNSTTYNIALLRRVRLYMEGGEDVDATVDKEFKIDGELLSGTNYFAKSVEESKIRQVSIFFATDDKKSEANSELRYVWDFYRMSNDATTTRVAPYMPDVISVVQADLGINSAKQAQVLKVDKADYKDDSRVESSKTISIIGIEESVALGEACVMGDAISFPMNLQTFDGKAVDVPETFAELKEKNQVLKKFPGGHFLNLLDIYGEELFSYADGKVILDATVIVIDGPVVDDPAARKLLDKYGVMLKKHDDKNYLYIFDGDKDGVANDPIALTVKDTGTVDPGTANDSGNSSCDAINSLLVLFVLGGAAFFLLRKKAR